LNPLRSLPSDAVILRICPVIIASATRDQCIQYLSWGAITYEGLGGALGPNQFDTPPAPQASFASTEFTDSHSLGASLSALEGQGIAMGIDSSLLLGTLADRMAATGVGYAIYYSSSSPRIDPQMPPPVAVPAGQGLAWALPFSVSLLGPPSLDGTAVATTATLNSI
jgi:hypothetical protein